MRVDRTLSTTCHFYRMCGLSHVPGRSQALTSVHQTLTSAISGLAGEERGLAGAQQTWQEDIGTRGSHREASR